MTQPLITDYYLIGNVIRLAGNFVDITCAPVDPDTITLEIKQPDGSILTVTYPSQIARVSIGAYYFDFKPTLSGIHYYRYIGTGACIAAGESVFDMKPTAIT